MNEKGFPVLYDWSYVYMQKCRETGRLKIADGSIAYCTLLQRDIYWHKFPCPKMPRNELVGKVALGLRQERRASQKRKGEGLRGETRTLFLIAEQHSWKAELPELNNC